MSLARPQETRQLPESSRAPDVVSLGEAKDTVVLKRGSHDCCSREGKVSATPQALLSDMCLPRPLSGLSLGRREIRSCYGIIIVPEILDTGHRETWSGQRIIQTSGAHFSPSTVSTDRLTNTTLTFWIRTKRCNPPS